MNNKIWFFAVIALIAGIIIIGCFTVATTKITGLVVANEKTAPWFQGIISQETETKSVPETNQQIPTQPFIQVAPTTTQTINSCRTLTRPNTIYVLENDVEADGACFIVQADSITIDCQNHVITYAIIDYGDGIFSDKQNTIVKNCILKKG